MNKNNYASKLIGYIKGKDKRDIDSELTRARYEMLRIMQTAKHNAETYAYGIPLMRGIGL